MHIMATHTIQDHAITFLFIVLPTLIPVFLYLAHVEILSLSVLFQCNVNILVIYADGTVFCRIKFLNGTGFGLLFALLINLIELIFDLLGKVCICVTY